MQRRLLNALLVTLLVSVGVPGGSTQALAQSRPKAQSGEGRPYEIADSEVWDVPDPVSGRGYQVYVALPPSYAKQPQRRYPVLYVTDADYAFPIIRQLARRLNVEGPQIEEFILVGLSYGKGEDGGVSRQRDYTPTPNGPSTAPANAVHGQARAYQAYLRDQVKPYITARYRTDPARTLFLGHSYGALLGTQILFTEPGMFNGYVLGSPSLWYDKRHALKLEARYAQQHRDLTANVYLYVGAYEALRKGDRRYNQTVDMVADNRALEAALQSRQYPGLKLKSVVLNDEDHLTVAPRGFMQALKYLLPVR
ncbi:alpha/beta hydrolase [Achromobacter xylosoxidans]|uniref:Alpha/beta hydrolase n=1 Tax=Alcaligenes xylosoxydans xylosoxydans TaxID=85698 RepID=A0A424WHQ1_ALCXX|nr:alpha/beta hydrolase-fold protein [Achromobacter xylosoxidans]MBC9902850.1 alpha/beta hydrolase [Achromobacter xylosoxidans]MBD0868548.1 alpha/beta hydrolase [Achromobacter xylosoxidans]QNP83269.1 alpha/beta hydrolase [Achromobacter xylosoxidans]RPJ92699.1 alpha/beta hydrolase [Achromobacter xylosoxidans]